MMISVCILLLLLIPFSIVVFNLPVFGRLPKGKRLASIMRLPNYRKGAIQNLSETPMQPEGVSMFTILKSYLFDKHPNRIPDKPLAVLKPDLNAITENNCTEIIWFGHSSYLIKTDYKRILVDPVFSKVASPFSFIGSKAFAGTDFVEAGEFLDIDVLVITHDHYDHLDYHSILKIAGNTKEIITSIGVGAHLERWGVPFEKINELCWNQTLELFNSLKFTAVPARHFTGRKLKRNQTLWSAFVLETPGHKMFLGGDSGYDTHFEEIGQKHGPFDIAFLECGQYNEYWPYIHMFPEQTVKAALDLQAEILMPVHWAKFSLAMHPWIEPAERVTAEASKRNLRIITPKLGENVVLKKDYPNDKWWNN